VASTAAGAFVFGGHQNDSGGIASSILGGDGQSTSSSVDTIPALPWETTATSRLVGQFWEETYRTGLCRPGRGFAARQRLVLCSRIDRRRL